MGAPMSFEDNDFAAIVSLMREAHMKVPMRLSGGRIRDLSGICVIEAGLGQNP